MMLFTGKTPTATNVQVGITADMALEPDLLRNPLYAHFNFIVNDNRSR